MRGAEKSLRAKKGSWLYDASNSTSRRKIKRGRNKEIRQILKKDSRKEFEAV